MPPTLGVLSSLQQQRAHYSAVPVIVFLHYDSVPAARSNHNHLSHRPRWTKSGGYSKPTSLMTSHGRTFCVLALLATKEPIYGQDLANKPARVTQRPELKTFFE
ncbi:hypothetical protein IHE45_08G109500 [Dioscorea alata]|uniref:Uncharacterized protein n=1 Tax=Dioscorea alata TaxID=55571 RepID=A0ACB7VL78_DIOAL|nr:hypothetical protein IHE45_08G109500 [Dioscorea alata]